MPMWFTNLFDGENTPVSLRGHEQGDFPTDDRPPEDHPSEQYSSWRASAIYSLSPFSAPPGR
jgi:hypothetical protein